MQPYMRENKRLRLPATKLIKRMYIFIFIWGVFCCPAYKQDNNADDVDCDFGNISLGKTPTQHSELDEYLASPVEDVKDPLMWWYNK
jgi:hypothetical protein